MERNSVGLSTGMVRDEVGSLVCKGVGHAWEDMRFVRVSSFSM